MRSALVSCGIPTYTHIDVCNVPAGIQRVTPDNEYILYQLPTVHRTYLSTYSVFHLISIGNLILRSVLHGTIRQWHHDKAVGHSERIVRSEFWLWVKANKINTTSRVRHRMNLARFVYLRCIDRKQVGDFFFSKVCLLKFYIHSKRRCSGWCKTCCFFFSCLGFQTLNFKRIFWNVIHETILNDCRRMSAIFLVRNADKWTLNNI